MPSTTKKKIDVPPEAVPDAVQGSCVLPGCVADASVQGLCDTHYWTHRGLARSVDEASPSADKHQALPEVVAVDE